MQEEFSTIARMPCQKIIYRHLGLIRNSCVNVIKFGFKNNGKEKEKLLKIEIGEFC